MASEERFGVVRRLLEEHGWTLTRIHGSHHIFEKLGRPLVSIPVHRGRVKAAYVRRVQKLVEEDVR